MVVITPIQVTNIPPAPDRSTPVIWIWLSLVLSLFVVEKIVVLDYTYGFNLLPKQFFTAITFVVASWSCYSDSALFAPWQLWSHVIVHQSWWQLAIEIALIVVIGRTLERALGTLAMGMALLTLAPMSATLFLLVGGNSILVGGHGLCLSMLGVAVGRYPRALVQWGLGYWLIIVVGYLPLFVLALPTMIILYMTLIIWLAPAATALSVAIWAACCVIVGIMIGLTGTRVTNS